MHMLLLFEDSSGEGLCEQQLDEGWSIHVGKRYEENMPLTRGNVIFQPPTSPDLNLLDTFFWSALKRSPLAAPRSPDSLDTTQSRRQHGQAAGQLASPPGLVRAAQRRRLRTLRVTSSCDIVSVTLSIDSVLVDPFSVTLHFLCVGKPLQVSTHSGARTELTIVLRGHPLEFEVCAGYVHNGLRMPSTFSSRPPETEG